MNIRWILGILVSVFVLNTASFAEPYYGDEGDGTKGTIGMVCVNMKGEKVTWLATTAQFEIPKAFGDCVDEAMKNIKSLYELEGGQTVSEKMGKWYMNTYNLFIDSGKKMGCEKQMTEDWKRRILESVPPKPTPDPKTDLPKEKKDTQ